MAKFPETGKFGPTSSNYHFPQCLAHFDISGGASGLWGNFTGENVAAFSPPIPMAKL